MKKDDDADGFDEAFESLATTALKIKAERDALKAENELFRMIAYQYLSDLRHPLKVVGSIERRIEWVKATLGSK